MDRSAGVAVQRRTSIPQPLEDPEHLTGVEEREDLRRATSAASTSAADGDLEGERAVQPLVSRPTLPLPVVDRVPRELRNLLAGGVAGMAAKTVVAPLDRIKILFQISSVPFHLARVPAVARNIVRDEGLLALWKGNTATMVRVFPYSGIQFMTFDRVKAYFLRQHEEAAGASGRRRHHRGHPVGGLTPWESLLAGMVAGTVSVVCTYPLDLTRAQLAVRRKHRHSHNLGFGGVLRRTYTVYGVRGLFRGIVPTVLGILPYSGIAFALNEQAKREIQMLTGRDLTTIERMQCGAFAGLFAQTSTYPLEVVRRRMQTFGLVGNDTALSSVGEAHARDALKLPSIGTIIRDLYQEQGVRGFFKGVSMNWMKGPIAFSISFTAYDTVKMLMETDAERRVGLSRRISSLRSEK